MLSTDNGNKHNLESIPEDARSVRQPATKSSELLEKMKMSKFLRASTHIRQNSGISENNNPLPIKVLNVPDHFEVEQSIPQHFYARLPYNYNHMLRQVHVMNLAAQAFQLQRFSGFRYA